MATAAVMSAKLEARRATGWRRGLGDQAIEGSDAGSKPVGALPTSIAIDSGAENAAGGPEKVRRCSRGSGSWCLAAAAAAAAAAAVGVGIGTAIAGVIGPRTRGDTESGVSTGVLSTGVFVGVVRPPVK